MKTQAATTAQSLRCAIYTRKSSEEGLEQSFNSLHAQRESCEAYVLSQASEGWAAMAAAYDDGGFSGGNLERPALQRLLADITAGKVDTVVVYKVDRLTRSLSDFARIVDAFDAKGVSFVSVTQSFNTTTSMGRLTLNVLLSFAQFEREVTGERIRDKIAASKAKGMWMGGNLPLGYDAGDHTLIVNEAEAVRVRFIFQRYLALASVRALQDELHCAGMRSKARLSKNGPGGGGVEFSRGALCYLLQNRHYLGEIRHKERTFPGRHQQIVDSNTFEAVQTKLESNRVRRRERGDRAAVARLAGRIVWSDGSPMAATFTYGRNGKLYRYYVASGQIPAGEPDASPPRRVPSGQVEALVLELLRRLADRHDDGWAELELLFERLVVRPDEAHMLLRLEPLLSTDHPDLALERLRSRLGPGERAMLETGDRALVRIVLPIRLAFRGGRTWAVDKGGRALRRTKRQDLALVAALKTAHAVLSRARLNPSASAVSTDGKAPQSTYDRKLCLLALLSPKIQSAILEGRQPPSVMLQDLLGAKPPLLWADQDAWLSQLGRETRRINGHFQI